MRKNKQTHSKVDKGYEHFSKEDIYEAKKHMKNAHHQRPSEKCKSKPRDTISRQLE